MSTYLFTVAVHGAEDVDVESVAESLQEEVITLARKLTDGVDPAEWDIHVTPSVRAFR